MVNLPFVEDDDVLSMEAHETMSSQALASAKVRSGLRNVLLGIGQLYEELRNNGDASSKAS